MSVLFQLVEGASASLLLVLFAEDEGVDEFLVRDLVGLEDSRGEGRLPSRCLLLLLAEEEGVDKFLVRDLDGLEDSRGEERLPSLRSSL